MQTLFLRKYLIAIPIICIFFSLSWCKQCCCKFELISRLLQKRRKKYKSELFNTHPVGLNIIEAVPKTAWINDCVGDKKDMKLDLKEYCLFNKILRLKFKHFYTSSVLKCRCKYKRINSTDQYMHFVFSCKLGTQENIFLACQIFSFKIAPCAHFVFFFINYYLWTEKCFYKWWCSVFWL